LYRTLLIALVSASAAVGGALPAYAQSANESFPGCPLLLEGQSSECVRALQGYLNLDNYGYRLAEDGNFGPGTQIAVLDYQG
jgi:peptidoglycan hydrolase-like protein with peptidoglycan-binding domain